MTWTGNQLAQAETWTKWALSEQEARLRGQATQPQAEEDQLAAAEAALKATLGLADPTLPPVDGEIAALPANDGANEETMAHPAGTEATALPGKEGAVALPTEEGEE